MLTDALMFAPQRPISAKLGPGIIRAQQRVVAKEKILILEGYRDNRELLVSVLNRASNPVCLYS